MKSGTCLNCLNLRCQPAFFGNKVWCRIESFITGEEPRHTPVNSPEFAEIRNCSYLDDMDDPDIKRGDK